MPTPSKDDLIRRATEAIQGDKGILYSSHYGGPPSSITDEGAKKMGINPAIYPNEADYFLLAVPLSEPRKKKLPQSTTNSEQPTPRPMTLHMQRLGSARAVCATNVSLNQLVSDSAKVTCKACLRKLGLAQNTTNSEQQEANIDA